MCILFNPLHNYYLKVLTLSMNNFCDRIRYSFNNKQMSTLQYSIVLADALYELNWYCTIYYLHFT